MVVSNLHRPVSVGMCSNMQTRLPTNCCDNVVSVVQCRKSVNGIQVEHHAIDSVVRAKPVDNDGQAPMVPIQDVRDWIAKVDSRMVHGHKHKRLQQKLSVDHTQGLGCCFLIGFDVLLHVLRRLEQQKRAYKKRKDQ